VLGLAALACAQSENPAGKLSLSGVVSDPSGAVVVGAVVTVTGAAGGTRTATTNERGYYSFGGLPAGSYDLSVSAAGFKVFHAPGIVLAAGQSLPLDASLELAEASTATTVEGQKTVQVETESAAVSGTITQTEVVSYGLNGRNFTQLIALAPGVSNQTGQDEAKVGVNGSVKYSVNGGRVEYNTFDVDGSDLLNVGINGSNSTLIVYPSLDSIQEVKVLTSNYGAMYGRTASGTVLVTTKSGTRDFHGNAYEFLRNEFFNARNYFDETRYAPLYRRNDFGFTIGGPVLIPKLYNPNKDKTFFFFSQEFRFERSPFEFNQAVPTVAERSGDFNDVCPDRYPQSTPVRIFSRSDYPDCPSTGNKQTYPGNELVPAPTGIPTGALNRNAVAILNTGIIPLPNATSGCNSSLVGETRIDPSTGRPAAVVPCYVATISPPTNWREELFRLDHNFSSFRATFRYIRDSWDTTVVTPQWGYIQNSFPTVENRFVGPGTSAMARLTDTISPTLLNDFFVSYGDSHITLTNVPGPGAQLARPAALDSPCAPSPPPILGVLEQCPMGALFQNGFGGKMPGVVIAGTNAAYGGNGFAVDSSYMPWDHTNPIYTVGDTLSKALGKHTLQMGAEFIVFQRNQINSPVGATTGDVQGIITFTNQGAGSGFPGSSPTGNAFADFLLHTAQRDGVHSFQQDSAQYKYYQRYQIAEPYFQDDWRISPRLTLNLGLRVSLFGTYYEKNHNVFNWNQAAFNHSLASQATVDPSTGELLDANSGSPIPLNLNNLDPRITNGLVQCGLKGVPASCMSGHLFNPAPRIGFAWDPRGNGKTSLRAGYGIFYEHGTANEANTGSLEGSSPLVLDMIQVTPQNASWSCIGGGSPAAGCSPTGAFPLNVTSIPTEAVWPYVQQWSVSVQRELPQATVATVAYVGSKGTHLTAERQINQLPPVSDALNPFGPHQPILPLISNAIPGQPQGDCLFQSSGAELSNGTLVNPAQPAFLNLQAACDSFLGKDPNSLRQFAPGFGRIISLANIADSTYNAFQATLRRFHNGLDLGISYTYSHSIDDSSDRSDATFVNSFDLAANRANSNYDQRHLLNISYVYALPGAAALEKFLTLIDTPYNDDGTSPVPPPPSGPSHLAKTVFDDWELSGITIYQSGTPFSVINGGSSTAVSVLDNGGVANGAGAGSYPDVVGNPHLRAPLGSTNPESIGPQLLNSAAFAAPRGLTFGDAGRNFLNNPSRLNFDVAMLKHFKITEGTTLEFRAEVFNFFNHTQFRIYDANLGNQANNTISCYGDANTGYSAGAQNCLKGSSFLHPVDAHRARTMQFGLKYAF